MLLTNNTTPYHAQTYPAQDTDGVPLVLTVIKVTLAFTARGDVTLSDDQLPISLGDEYQGDAGASSLRYASDLVPEKKGTDIVLNGHAYAPNGQAVKKLKAGLAVGKVSKSVMVWGDRIWQVGMGMVSKSRPAAFVKMPLVYERAFGGEDRFHVKEKKWDVCRENPVGKGFRVTRSKEALDGLALPNLEDPDHPVKTWKDKPRPAGFGFVAPSWQPRQGLCGTFDKAWEERRMPLLPGDFDTGFYNAASHGLIHRPFLKGNEQVQLMNVHPESGNVRLKLPGLRPECKYIFEHQTYRRFPALDTLVIEPDLNRMILVFRCRYTGPEDISHLRQVNVYETN